MTALLLYALLGLHPSLLATIQGEMVTNVFIERRLELKNGGEVSVRFFLPEPAPQDWQCAYEIDWPDRQYHRPIFGFDAVQALFLAMQCAHEELLVSPENASGELTWLGYRDFGLPLIGAPTLR